MATRRLILLRHGQTTYNADKRMQGQLDTELSAVGIEQAHAAGQWMKNFDIAKIVSSDLSRAYDTAAIIGQALGQPVDKDARLRETHLGAWQGMKRVDVDAQFVGARATWRHDATWTPPKGESRVQVAARARSVVDELMASFTEWDGRAVLFVAHGGTIAALTSSLLGLDVTQYPMFKGLNNTNTSQLAARPRFDGANTPDAFTPDMGPDDVQWYLEAWNQGLTI
ncbi:histidine phosphatase family protein [Corynebacterium aquatimens]|uniref:phosphoglycerate mutase (2,3-diphosphoglycerate-dependent) n=1 Tax=Corynebacterium aquatimens TaxID=1190508 RepID=A0A931E1M7_9CORY|nr:histidine phosphatase family protein [Corynebacterium aquatimens]MBG6122121.1 putative phosphoglycerate mutase [Corynebacterium aquatimens]WJY65338.1 Glucosyl-3-phosphoglycerate phosphatase [Corynebacterium aquatimens]